ncbi:hypothetical protein MAR_007404 [Mya arenaria]|uniref:Uncharacterized protein n=1 Tax=Mya arenaria TaxID=6604 RepID=A0ABY7DFS4_MYAAR|nr:hypothetical protein MAR_007404 [Mya arenaria]
MDMVQSQGKMNKNVATLMTNEMDGHLSTWQSLRDMVNQAGCQRLELINSNSLQKYIATVCQILDLNEGEVQWVSSHLAHTVKTHLDLPLGESDDIPVHGESAYDSIDLNLAEHWNGDDEQPAEAQSSMPVNRSVPGLPRKDTYKSQTLKQPAETQSSMPVNQRPKRPRLSKKRHIQESDSEDVADDDSLIDPSFMDSGREESSTDDEQTSKNFIQQQKFYKQRWSETENKIFIQIFSACLKDKHLPTLTAIMLAASNMPQRTV